MCLVLMPFFSFILYIVRNVQQTVSKPKLCLLDDDPDYPIWKVLKKPIATMEASTSIVQLKYNKEQLCRRNPGICTSNACFLIDKSKLSHPDDILCDLHGKWELSKKKTIFYEYGEDLKLKKVEENSRGKMQRIRVERSIYYNETAKDFHKVLVSVENHPVSCLQYYFDGEVHNVVPKPHGNSKSFIPYVRCKKSVIEKIKASKEPPKDTVSSIFQEAGGFIGIKGPNEVPRNRQQIYRYFIMVFFFEIVQYVFSFFKS